MPKSPHHDEFFDVYYDIGESLFDRLRETMDRHFNADPRTPDDLAALKTIRDHVVQAVAAVEDIETETVYRDLEEIRTDPDEGLPPFFAELAEKVEALDDYVDHLTRSMKVYDADHPEGFPNHELDHLAHLRGLMILVKLVLDDFREDAKSLRETAECLEILGIKPAPKERP